MKGKKTGGRSKGTPNHATVELKAAAREFTADALKTLSEIMRDKKQHAAARVGAARELLDRGYGKPAQGIGFTDAEGNTAGPRRVIIELSDGEDAPKA